jgi:tetratricopeptide (TPR) repeat protein
MLPLKQSCRRVAITGLGGVGKTQIVLELVYRTREKSPECSVFWVPANSSASFEKGYTDIAVCLKLPGITEEKANVKQLVKAALNHESTGSWILIIDNADDVDVLYKRGDNVGSLPLIDYLPTSCTGSIIFTTRTRKAAVTLAGNNVIHVYEMSREDATEVLRRSLIQTDLLSEVEAVNKLLTLLAYLPLAIVQAVSYINKNYISILDYIALFESSEEDTVEVLSEDFEDQGRYKEMKNPVAATWLISFSQIRRQDQLAGEYLSFMACLARQNIPRSLLPVASSKKKEIDAIGTLTAYSFITKHEINDSFDVHRLVHIATRNWLRNENQLLIWIDKAFIQLADNSPTGDHKNRAIWIIYLPHASHVLAQSRLSARNENAKITLLHNVGQCLHNNGQYREAEQIHRQVLELNKKVLGPEHPDTLTSMNNVATALSNQGNYHKAEEMH